MPANNLTYRYVGLFSFVPHLSVVVTFGLIGLADGDSQTGPRRNLADGIEITAKASKAEYAQL